LSKRPLAQKEHLSRLKRTREARKTKKKGVVHENLRVWGSGSNWNHRGGGTEKKKKKGIR